MPWETRKRGGRYYTRAVRIGGEVVRQYIGAGPLADQAALADAATRQARASQRAGRRLQRSLVLNLERQLDDLCQLTEHVIACELRAAGYHQHARGEWRKTRVAKTASPA